MGNNNPEGLSFLINQLKDEDVYFFVHWDKTSKIDIRNQLKKEIEEQINWVKPIKVSWGGYSQINAQLNLLQMARKSEAFDYYHLISDNDIPLMSLRYFKSFFKENNGEEFIGYSNSDDSKFGWSSRLRYYYPFEELDFPRLLKKILEVFSINIQRSIGIDRLSDNNIEIKKGPSWYSVTNRTVEYILSKRKEINYLFKKSSKADEIYIQSEVWNNLILKNKLRAGNEFVSSARYIDWHRGNPYVFSDKDESEIQKVYNTQYAFARKIKISDNINLKRWLIFANKN